MPTFRPFYYIFLVCLLDSFRSLLTIKLQSCFPVSLCYHFTACVYVSSCPFIFRDFEMNFDTDIYFPLLLYRQTGLSHFDLYCYPNYHWRILNRNLESFLSLFFYRNPVDCEAVALVDNHYRNNCFYRVKLIDLKRQRQRQRLKMNQRHCFAHELTFVLFLFLF